MLGARGLDVHTDLSSGRKIRQTFPFLRVTDLLAFVSLRRCNDCFDLFI